MQRKKWTIIIKTKLITTVDKNAQGSDAGKKIKKPGIQANEKEKQKIEIPQTVGRKLINPIILTDMEYLR